MRTAMLCFGNTTESNMKIKYKIPPTTQMGSFETIGVSNSQETAYQNALWDYNSAREHDWLRPVKCLPEGTKSEILEFDD